MTNAHSQKPEWLTLYQQEYAAFLQACQDPQEIQEQRLRQYVQNNRHTVFGRQHDFKNIQSYAQFARNVPLHQHADLSAYLAQVAAGQQQVLTAEPVLAFEETSGTDTGAKRIPYTQTLRDEFDRAIGVWLWGIAQDYPEALRGDLYLSLSPPLKKTSPDPLCRIPVGLGDDASYFRAEVFAQLSKAIITVHTGGVRDADAFYQRTLESLLSSGLSFISVWSPTFFLSLDKRLQAYLHRTRARSGPFVWKDVFPSLSLLSCWTHAQSALWIPQVQERLGALDIQGKGLLSTEGLVSIPVQKGQDPVLAVRSHFFEFRDQAGAVHPAYDVQSGGVYDVVLTTGAGLYRYLTGDRVQVTGFYAQVPCLNFLGRSGRQSDLVGEKLSEACVNQALEKARRVFAVSGCAFLCPVSPQQYTLYTDSRLPEEDLLALARNVEQHLRKNPYYDQACRLGQLEPMAVQRLPENFERHMIPFLCQQSNMKEGDLKISSLYRQGELDVLLKDPRRHLPTERPVTAMRGPER